jgi:tetratricopeptide (TPR) repeat protein
MHNLKINKTIALAVLITALLWAGCSGSSETPIDPGPTGSGNGSQGTATGILVDMEGYPLGGFDTFIEVKNADGISVTPKFNPPASGPEAGQFTIQNLPVGQTLYFIAEHRDQFSGRFIGYEQELFFSTAETISLGEVMLDNPWLDLGWDSYKQKDYQQALIYFNRALGSRKISGNPEFTLSSSAYTGIAWVHAKRGKDNMAINPMFPGFEWDQALSEFDFALANFKDADAWAGKGGLLLSLLADVNADPAQIGPLLPVYGLIHPHFSEIYTCLEQALVAAPDYFCEHDLIAASDLQAIQLLLTWLISENVTLNDVEIMADADLLNEGSMQLLAIMPELLLYNPYPQK